jgi:hypothetical protein
MMLWPTRQQTVYPASGSRWRRGERSLIVTDLPAAATCLCPSHRCGEVLHQVGGAAVFGHRVEQGVHVLGPPQVALGQVGSGVGTDQVGLGEQVAGRVVAGRPVADQVDLVDQLTCGSAK